MRRGEWGGGTYAILITESGQIDIRKIKTENGLLFYVPEYGIYQINKENRLIYGKSQVYIFDQKAINSLNIEAIVDIRKYLKEKNKTKLDEREAAFLVERLQMKVTEAKLLNDLETLGIKEDEQLKEMLDKKIIDAANREYQELKKNFDDSTVDFLNQYYSVDTMAHTNTWVRIFQHSKMTMKKSGKKMPWWIWQKTIYAPQIALVVIDNRLLDVDTSTSVKLELEPDEKTGKLKTVTYLYSKKYKMKWKVADTKTIYRYRKTRVYVVAVKTEPVKQSEPAQEKQQSIEVTAQ